MTGLLVQAVGAKVDRSEDFEDAFVALFVRARRVALRVLGDVARAEDVAGETLARALVSWPRIRTFPEAWVTRVATNLAIDAARRRQARLPVAPAEGPEEAVVSRVALVGALRRLPRRQREAVALRYLVGLPEGEVAEALGLTAGTVKTHLRRGLEALRRRSATDLEEVTDVTHDSTG